MAKKPASKLTWNTNKYLIQKKAGNGNRVSKDQKGQQENNKENKSEHTST